MNYIAMHQWLEGLRAGIRAKGGDVLWATLETNAWNGDCFRWRVKFGIRATPTDYFDSGDKTTPEEALIAANEWVANWMHPDKRLALVLGIDTEPKTHPLPAAETDSGSFATDDLPF